MRHPLVIYNPISVYQPNLHRNSIPQMKSGSLRFIYVEKCTHIRFDLFCINHFRWDKKSFGSLGESSKGTLTITFALNFIDAYFLY